MSIYKTENLIIDEIKGSSFKFELDQDLTEEHLEALGLKEQLGHAYTIEGDYSLEWDDDIPNVVLGSLYISLDDRNSPFIEIDLDDCYNNKSLIFDGYEIEALLAEQDNNDWYADRQADLTDSYDYYNE